MDYDIVFYAGIVLPTVVTVIIFVVFLVCWFKFHLKERILAFARSKGTDDADHGSGLPKHIYSEEQGGTDVSETASDSAIDVSLHDDTGKTENCAVSAEGIGLEPGKEDWTSGLFDAGAPTSHRHCDETAYMATQARDQSARSSVSQAAIQCTNAHELLINPNSLAQHKAQGSTASSTVTVADVHVNITPARLKKGTYPSIETLVEERSTASPNTLYEWSDRMRDFAHAVRAQTAAYASIRRPQAHWPAPATSAENYMALTKPGHEPPARATARCGGCHGQQCNQTCSGQNGCNHAAIKARSGLPRYELGGMGGSPAHHPHSHATEVHLGSQPWRPQQQQQYHSSSILTWTPNIRGSTSSNNDNYSAMGTSRV